MEVTVSRLSKILFLFSGISLASFGIVYFLIGQWVPFLWIPVGLFFLLTAFALFTERNLIKEFLTLRTTKHGMNMGVLILLVFTCLVTVNFISVRNYKTWDFSKEHINSLSEQSIKLLKSLDSDLSVKFFYQKGAEGVDEAKRGFRELLKRYQDESKFVKLEFIDVNERPDLAEQYGVTKGSGVVYLDYKGRKNKIEKIEEQEITSALVKVTRDSDKIIYVTTGHGELDLNQAREAQGAAALKSLLEGNRYQVRPLPLVTSPKVPDDANVLIIPGATQAFLEPEVKAIEAYLQKGGNLLLALNPKTNHGLDGLVKALGLQLQNNFVVTILETAFGKAINPESTPATVFSSTHQITKPFGQNQFAIFRLPQGLKKVEPAAPGLTIDEIVKTGDKAMAFPDTKFDKDAVSGTFTVAAAVKGKFAGADDKAPEFMAVVVGNSDFLNNQRLYQNLNRDLALNSVGYLSREENLISIAPREVGVTKMQLPDHKLYMFLVFALAVPLCLLGTSLGLWYRRRAA